jgi:hypothetical protein
MNFSRRKKNMPLPDGDWRMLLTNAKGSPGGLAPFEIQILIRQ